MKKRYIYSILFGIPGLIVSAIISVMVSGFAAGVFWIFIFGDNPWPAYAEKLLPVLFIFVFLAVWLTSLITGYLIGKRLERDLALNKMHILVSAVVVVLSVLLIVFQQLSVGNIGPQSDEMRCSNFCTQKGYSASSMPPRISGERICSCLDNSGHGIITVPIDSIPPVK